MVDGLFNIMELLGEILVDGLDDCVLKGCEVLGRDGSKKSGDYEFVLHF